MKISVPFCDAPEERGCGPWSDRRRVMVDWAKALSGRGFVRLFMIRAGEGRVLTSLRLRSRPGSW